MEWQESQNALCIVLHARDFPLQALSVTQRNRSEQVQLCVWRGVCHSSQFVIMFFWVFFCLHRHVPNSVLSIDLSQHLDSADDNNAAAAQWVSHVALSNRHKYKVSPQLLSVFLLWLNGFLLFPGLIIRTAAWMLVSMTMKCWLWFCKDQKKRAEGMSWLRFLLLLPWAVTLSSTGSLIWGVYVCACVWDLSNSHRSKCVLRHMIRTEKLHVRTEQVN